MDALSLDAILAVCQKRHVHSIHLTPDGGLAVSFMPDMGDFEQAAPDAEPGGWKRSPVTPSDPPTHLDLPAIWGDEPSTK